MKSSLRYALLGGAVIVAAAGAAAAGMDAGAPNSGRHHRPYGGRIFAQFDLNKDGKVTRDEVGKVTAKRFAEAGGGAGAIALSRYEGAQAAKARARVDGFFRRTDWNSDGKVSLDEYAATLRAQFQRMDHDGRGAVACAAKKAQTPGKRHGTRGAGKLCRDADANKDGMLTRAELDKAAARKFAVAAKGASALTPVQFASLDMARVSKRGHSFGRLDANGDGKLSRDEFAARDTRMFARLDRNNDGVVTKDEAAVRSHDKRGKQDRG